MSMTVTLLTRTRCAELILSVCIFQRACVKCEFTLLAAAHLSACLPVEAPLLQVCDALEDVLTAGGAVVDYHGCDFFPER